MHPPGHRQRPHAAAGSVSTQLVFSALFTHFQVTIATTELEMNDAVSIQAQLGEGSLFGP